LAKKVEILMHKLGISAYTRAILRRFTHLSLVYRYETRWSSIHSMID
jgi:hypothetical protein